MKSIKLKTFYRVFIILMIVSSISFSAKAYNQSIWFGHQSSDWNDRRNWSQWNWVDQTYELDNNGNLANLPSNGDAVEIEGYNAILGFGIYMPVLPSDFTLEGVYFNPNTTLDLNNHSLIITTSLYYSDASNYFIGSPTSSLTVYSGYNAENSLIQLDASTHSGSSLYNLTLIGPGGNFTLNNDIYIYNLLSIQDNTHLFSGLSYNGSNPGKAILMSTADNTASLDQFSNPAGPVYTPTSIQGVITVQRYIPKGLRAYRDLSAGGVSSGTGDYFTNWQNSGATTPGSGVYISGEKGSAAGHDGTTGFDYTSSGNPSLYTYQNSVWASVAKTHTGSAIDGFQGNRVLVRGDRNISNFGFGTDPTSMNNSTVISNTGYPIIGDVNYTASSIEATMAGFNRQGVPLQLESVSSTPGLTTGNGAFTLIGNPYAAPIDWDIIAGTSTTTGNITGITTSYFYFDPTFFNSGYATYVTYNSYSGISSNPSGSKVSNIIQPGSAFFIQNDNSGTSPTMTISENAKAIGSSSNGVFGVRTKPSYISVGLWKNVNGIPANIDGTVAAFDKSYTNAIDKEDSKKMSNEGENMSITIGINDLSIAGLPIPAVTDAISLKLDHIIPSTAYQLKVDVSKFTSNDVDAYIHDALTNTDVAAATGINFTATSDSYKNRFSIIFKSAKTITANINKGTAVYPNPVTGNSFILQMNNLDKGTYEATIYNSKGQQVTATIINHAGGSNNQTIAIKTLPAGVYTLKVSGNGEKYNTEMIVK